MAKHPPRPRDPMQLAKLIGDIATGEIPNDSPRAEAETRETAWRRKGGRKGAKARAQTLSAKQRTAIAKKAAKARWRRS